MSALPGACPTSERNGSQLVWQALASCVLSAVSSSRRGGGDAESEDAVDYFLAGLEDIALTLAQDRRHVRSSNPISSSSPRPRLVIFSLLRSHVHPLSASQPGGGGGSLPRYTPPIPAQPQSIAGLPILNLFPSTDRLGRSRSLHRCATRTAVAPVVRSAIHTYLAEPANHDLSYIC